MKKSLKITIFLLVLSLTLSMVAVPSISNAEEKPELRGVWVASVVNIDYPSKATMDVESLKSEAIKILDNAKAMRMNAVFLQVRPASDALYKSKYFPWSKYLTGIQGLAPADGFDPLSFWVEEAHKRGMELHAWINPYRITKKTAAEPAQELATLYPFNPAVLHPEWVVKYMDDLYYDPGIPEVRQLVIDGVLEIVEGYNVDGIHFDDYFYPAKGFNDAASYKKYGSAYKSIDDWRRENVNILIKDLSKAINDTGKPVSFGVSPFGIWANSSSSPLGSDTKGNQSYFSQYADTRKWVKEGWLDYIAPQIYWNIGYSIADYSKIVGWWEDVVDGTKVDLYIGQAAYKAGNSNPMSPWYGVAEIEKQLKLNEESPEVKGSIFFSYKSFANNPALSAAVKAIHEQQDGVVAETPVTVARPWGNTRTSLAQYYIAGASDPAKPLYINGKLIEKRSSQGFFGVLVNLTNGANAFTFSQEGTFATRVIFKDSAAP
ncbi:MAG: hypothetical protein K0R84_2210, partial [Clostridia bacterium]|nr:hypothetical protein [Clostridia bacterium]